MTKIAISVGILATVFCVSVRAQTISVMTLDQAGAQTILQAARESAQQRNAPSAIAVVDPAGDLLAFQRMDGVRPASADLVIEKDLIREAFALPCLCYAEDGWQRRGMLSGPPGWAVCHDSAREPRMFLGHLHRDDVRLLTHEFGLHRRGSVDHQVEFKDWLAGRPMSDAAWVVNEAARLTARAQHDRITEAFLEQALNRLRYDRSLT
jgi:hypothetical protein